MQWLIGGFYLLLLYVVYAASTIKDKYPGVFASVLVGSLFIGLLFLIVLDKQKKNYKENLRINERRTDLEVERITQINEEKLKEVDSELERLNSINVLETAKLFDTLAVHLKKLVPVMDGETYESYMGYKLAFAGWSEVTYTPLTGDYGADIIANDKDGKRTCIQCKRYENPVGVEAVQEVLAAKQYYNAERAIVATNSVLTSQAHNMAQKTGVELWEHFV